MQDFFNLPFHMVVYATGRCKRCNLHNEVVIHDYGKMSYRDLEKEMDNTRHIVRPIVCKKCGTSFSPEFFVYKDHLRNLVISKTRLLLGDLVDAEEAERMQEGHQKRFDVFKAKEDEFWRGYVQYALENWRTIVNELLKEEIEEAYEALGIKERFRTAQQYRRDVLNRFTTPEEKAAFWRAANRYFIVDRLLDLGPEAWQVNKDKQLFGLNRTRYAILNFPLHENLETMRTKYIGEIVKLDKGDNHILFRRISQLTDELKRAKKKTNEYFHKVESMKVEISEYQRKLNEAYEELKKEREDKRIIYRNPDDVRKINELKSFVKELMQEIKERDILIKTLTSNQQDNDASDVTEDIQAAELDESRNDTEKERTDIAQLEGKTIGILGGWRRNATEYPCRILTHNGEKLDPDFYALLSHADILVVLTRFVSHAAMWEAKAHAIMEDKPILYEQGTNLERILMMCCNAMQ